MNHDFDNENDNDMDDDDAEDVPRAPKPPKNGAAAKAPKKSSNKESERKKRELITMGKAKGFLTYDEVNDHMPEDIVSSDQIDDWLSALGDEGIEIVDSASKLKVAEKARRRSRGRRRGRGDRDRRRREGRGRGGGRRRRLLQDQRPRAHVPAQDGLGLAAHPRGRGRDRQAHRGRRAARAAGRAQLARSPSRRSSSSATSCASSKIRVKDVVKDADEDDAEFDEQWHIERVCKVIDKVRRLWTGAARRSSRSSTPRASSEATRKKATRSRSTTQRSEMFDALQELRLNKKQIDRIVAQAQGRWSSASSRPNREIVDCEQQVGHVAEGVPQDAARDPVDAAAPARGRQEARHPRRRARGDVDAIIQNAQQEDQAASRRRPSSTETVLRDTVREHPRRRAHGRARQGRAGRGQPAPRGLDRQEVHEPRPAVPRPDPGGQHRPDEGRRQVRVQARLQVLDLRHVVDPPGDHPRDRRPGAHDPHPGAHDRDDQQAHPHQRATSCRSSAASRRRKRSPRRWSCRSTRSARS